MNWYKNKITLAVALLIVLVVGGIIVSKTRNGEGASRMQVAEESQLQAGPVEVRGTVECLPYMRGGADQECVNGLLGEDGNFYALSFASPRGVDRNIGRGSEVLVKGTYAPADTSSEESGVFRYEGVITVTSIVSQ
jgi:hypothetical protein